MTEDMNTSVKEIKTSDIDFPVFPLPRVRIRIALVGIMLGFLVMLIGAKPSWFGLDRSPVVGFIQIAVMLIGLAII